MKIQQLTVENFKRIRVIEVKPDGDVVRITGRNASGKSSCLDSIQAALAGKSASPPEPIHRGEDEAVVEIETDGDLKVRRTWKGGSSKLTVYRSGSRVTSPQRVLDELYSAVALDPLAFLSLSKEDQRVVFAEGAGILEKLREADLAVSQLYESRRVKNAQAKDAERKLSPLPTWPHDTPVDEVDDADTVIQETNRLQQAINDEVRLRDETQSVCSKITDIQREIERLLHELKILESRLKQLESRERLDLDDAKACVDALGDRLSLAQAADRHRQDMARQAEASANVQQLRDEAEKLDAELIAARSDRRALIAEATPVDGLTIDDEGRVSMLGIPIEQASQAERVRISAAIAMAQNRELRVMLIRDGNTLDSESLRQLTEAAKQHDMQLWIEQVDETGDVGVYLEEGYVAADIASDGEPPAGD